MSGQKSRPNPQKIYAIIRMAVMRFKNNFSGGGEFEKRSNPLNDYSYGHNFVRFFKRLRNANGQQELRNG